MNKIRLYHISFFIFLVISILCFMSGFYYGTVKNTTMLSHSEKPMNENEVKKVSTISNADKYYLRKTGTYYAVFKGDNTSIYFETELTDEDIPEALTRQQPYGIEFESLEELYGFLENYSS